MTTLERLQTLLAKNYPSQQAVSRETTLEDLQIDSLGVMELFFSIEDEFQLKVPNDRVELKTVGDVADYIDRLIEEQHGGRRAVQQAS